MSPFDPPVALASLSGAADADWARAGASHAGCAFLGGVAVDGPTREAAEALAARDRSEFLPADPVDFVADQLAALSDIPLRPGVNVRAATTDPLKRLSALCATHDAVLEINAHCRQPEMCAAGAGHALLRDPDRLAAQIRAAASAGATVSLKCRTEVEGVDLPAVCRRVVAAGAELVHVDAMDSEPVIADVVAATGPATVVANNGVRGRASAEEYLRYGADAVSVGRASDDPAVLARVCRAVERFRERPVLDAHAGPGRRDREGERRAEP